MSSSSFCNLDRYNGCSMYFFLKKNVIGNWVFASSRTRGSTAASGKILETKWRYIARTLSYVTPSLFGAVDSCSGSRCKGHPSRLYILSPTFYTSHELTHPIFHPSSYWWSIFFITIVKILLITAQICVSIRIRVAVLLISNITMLSSSAIISKFSLVSNYHDKISMGKC